MPHGRQHHSLWSIPSSAPALFPQLGHASTFSLILSILDPPHGRVTAYRAGGAEPRQREVQKIAGLDGRAHPALGTPACSSAAMRSRSKISSWRSSSLPFRAQPYAHARRLSDAASAATTARAVIGSP